MHNLFKCFWVLMMGAIFNVAAALERPSTAFYYANKLPVELLATYQRVVVEPDNVTAAELQQLKQRGVRVYAYFSIGEVGPDRSWLKELNAAWILGVNAGWKSSVMDLTQSGWRDYVLKKQLQALWNRGFEGFFLDTMDSYQLFAKSEAEQKQQQQGMVELIKGMKSQFAGVHLLFNRGFEVLDRVAQLSDGIVAESLFRAWDPAHASYKEVSEQDRTWLINKLTSVRDQYALPVTVLDYVPPEQRELAKITADKIKALGFIPWVSTPALDYMGVGELNLIPRKVLYLYDAQENELSSNEIHRFMAMPLEYLGYVPEYLNIREPLPDYILKGRYAGMVVWLDTGQLAQDKRFTDWLLRNINNGIKVAFLNFFPFKDHAQLMQALQLTIKPGILKAPINMTVSSKHIGFEIQPMQRRLSLSIIQSTSKANSWLRVTGADNTFSDPVFTAAWGGIALAPYVLFEATVGSTHDKVARWIINPFEFLKQSLQLVDLPAADLTTENGRRILTAHIDGDGFYNKTELSKNSYSSELIMREFIQKSQLPHTVSVIEGEIGATGLKPELSSELEALARQIFQLPNVEMASHTYSHPFDWNKAASSSHTAQVSANTVVGVGEKYIVKEGGYILPIPGYRYNVEREIAGSVSYIDKHLAPAQKKTKVLLWSGDCLPNEEALALADKLKITNMNGGDTIIRKGLNSLVNISASGIVRGQYFQPFAPIQNENVYTHNWHGPFYGYQQVIETFKLTGLPRRIKPISIYYHFYSGDKIASVQALQRVYAWVQQQQTLPLWISEYTPRLFAFRSAVYEQLAQGWRIHGASELRTLRLNPDAAPPDLKHSQGLIGYQRSAEGLFLAFNGQDTITLQQTDQAASSPYLENSNARVAYWQKDEHGLQFRFKGHVPVTLVFGNMHEHCVLKDAQQKILPGEKQQALRVFHFIHHDTGDLRLTCEQS